MAEYFRQRHSMRLMSVTFRMHMLENAGGGE